MLLSVLLILSFVFLCFLLIPQIYLPISSFIYLYKISSFYFLFLFCLFIHLLIVHYMAFLSFFSSSFRFCLTSILFYYFHHLLTFLLWFVYRIVRQFHNPINPQLPTQQPRNQKMAPSRGPITIKSRPRVRPQSPDHQTSNHRPTRPQNQRKIRYSYPNQKFPTYISHFT